MAPALVPAASRLTGTPAGRAPKVTYFRHDAAGDLAEAFNALNHPNFDNPVNATSGSSSILSTLFGSVCCATAAPPTTQTIIQTGEAGRVIQWALKLSF